MTVATLTRMGIEGAKVIPLTELVSALIKKQEFPELNDPNLKYLLIDASSYSDASRIADPIGVILDYASMVRNSGKEVIVFGIDELGDRNLKLSKGYKALSALGVGYTSKGLEETLNEYCR